MNAPSKLHADWLRLDESARRARTLTLVGREPATSGLLTRGKDHVPTLLPLANGSTRVGRNRVDNYVEELDQLVGVIEGQQWLVTSDALGVRIRDYGSTNGSVVVRQAAGVCEATFRELLVKSQQGDTEVEWLGWNGTTSNSAYTLLEDGDVLVNAYRSFVLVDRVAKGQVAGAIGPTGAIPLVGR